MPALHRYSPNTTKSLTFLPTWHCASIEAPGQTLSPCQSLNQSPLPSLSLAEPTSSRTLLPQYQLASHPTSRLGLFLNSRRNQVIRVLSPLGHHSSPHRSLPKPFSRHPFSLQSKLVARPQSFFPTDFALFTHTHLRGVTPRRPITFPTMPSRFQSSSWIHASFAAWHRSWSKESLRSFSGQSIWSHPGILDSMPPCLQSTFVHPPVNVRGAAIHQAHSLPDPSLATRCHVQASS